MMFPCDCGGQVSCTYCGGSGASRTRRYAPGYPIDRVVRGLLATGRAQELSRAIAKGGAVLIDNTVAPCEVRGVSAGYCEVPKHLQHLPFVKMFMKTMTSIPGDKVFNLVVVENTGLRGRTQPLSLLYVN